MGVEIEVPFTFYSANNNGYSPESKINGLQLATQYTFLVNEKHTTSLVVGYLHKLGMSAFGELSKQTLFSHNEIKPFFVDAKRWGNNFHTLIYAGPAIE